jgi:hypothetical protein
MKLKPTSAALEEKPRFAYRSVPIKQLAFPRIQSIKLKAKSTLEQAKKAQRRSRGVAPLFL